MEVILGSALILLAIAMAKTTFDKKSKRLEKASRYIFLIGLLIIVIFVALVVTAILILRHSGWNFPD